MNFQQKIHIFYYFYDITSRYRLLHPYGTSISAILLMTTRNTQQTYFSLNSRERSYKLKFHLINNSSYKSSQRGHWHDNFPISHVCYIRSQLIRKRRWPKSEINCGRLKIYSYMAIMKMKQYVDMANHKKSTPSSWTTVVTKYDRQWRRHARYNILTKVYLLVIYVFFSFPTFNSWFVSKLWLFSSFFEFSDGN